MSLIYKEAPTFVADGVFKNEFKTIDLAKYRGKWVVLFFYPLDFTFVCPTEIIAMSDLAAEFKAKNAEILGVSTDSKFSHNAWMLVPRNEGGIGQLEYPLVSDYTKKIATDYDVLLEDGVALRATFIIDPEGVVRYELKHDLAVGRNVKEILRSLEALQFAKEHGEVCPANWIPGGDTIVPDIKKSKEYFKKIKQ